MQHFAHAAQSLQRRNDTTPRQPLQRVWTIRDLEEPQLIVPRSDSRQERFEWEPHPERHLESSALARAPPRPKDIVGLARFRVGETAHVFNTPDRDFSLFKHGNRFPRIEQRDFLWRADDDSTCQRQQLR